MGHVKEYVIPNFGENNSFSIGHYDETEAKKIWEIMSVRIEPGYYGFHGAMTLPKRSNTLEEAEGVLANEILKMMTKEEEIHSRRSGELSQLISEVSSPSGISKYLVA